MNFERGKDPRSTMGIGIPSQIDKSIKELLEKNGYNVCNTSIRAELEKDISLQIGVKITLDVREVEDSFGKYILIVECKSVKYKKEFDVQGPLFMPNVQKVAAKTISQDLVQVQPMSAPKASIHYLDYKYGKNKFGIPKKLWDKTKKILRKNHRNCKKIIIL